MDCRIHNAQINEIIKEEEEEEVVKKPLCFSCIHSMHSHLTLDRYLSGIGSLLFSLQFLMKNSPSKIVSPNRWIRIIRILQEELILSSWLRFKRRWPNTQTCHGKAKQSPMLNSFIYSPLKTYIEHIVSKHVCKLFPCI